MAHGFSAAIGKVGALSADIILGLVRGLCSALPCPAAQASRQTCKYCLLRVLQPRAATALPSPSASFEGRAHWTANLSGTQSLYAALWRHVRQLLLR